MASTFTGFVDGTWGEPGGKTNKSIFDFEEDTSFSRFEWGTPAHAPYPDPNSLVFTKNLAFEADANKPFAVGELTFFNGSVFTDTVVDSVPLKIELDLDSPTDETKVFEYDLGLNTTEDSLSESEDEWSDFVYFPNTWSSNTFTFDGKEYTLELLGFSKDNGKTIESQFRVLEQDGDAATLFAQVTEAPKREPAGDPNSTPEGAEEAKNIDKKEFKEIDEIGFEEGGVRDNVDLYRFKIDTYSEVNITLDQLERNANIDILAENGTTLVAQSRETGDKEENIIENLNPGTYYARVYPETITDKTPYRLRVSADDIKDEKDSFDTAQDLGVLGWETSVVDKIGQGKGKRRDTNDYYKFTLEETRDFVLNLDQLKRNADVELLNSNGDVLETGDNNGRKRERFKSESLEAGEYYVRVFPKGNKDVTDYRLGLSALEIPVDNDNKAPGTDLGVLLPDGNALKNKDRLGTNNGRRDTQDYYKFTLAADSNIKLTVDGLRGKGKNLDLKIFEWENGELGSEVADPGEKRNSIIWQPRAELPAGEYVVSLKANGNANTPYNLRLIAEPPYEDDYPTRPEALDFGDVANLDKEKVHRNEIGFQYSLTDKDQRDYFRFEVSEDKTVQLELTGLTGNADMRLYEGNEAGILDSSTKRGNKNESITYDAEAGEEYFIEIFPGKGKGKADYNLKVEPVEEGQQIEEFEVGDLNQRPQSKYTSPSDSEVGEVKIVKNVEDRYNFSISEDDTVVEINLTNLSDNLNLKLEEANGTEIDFQDERRTTSEKIVQNLPPGNYVAKVLTQNNADSGYQFTMKALDEGDVDPDGGLPTSPAPLPFVQDIGVLSEFAQTDDIGGRKNYGRDQNDYYKLELTTGQDFSLDFSAKKAVSRVQLLDSGLSTVKNFNRVKTESFTESGLEAGTYYVRVQAGSSSTSYTLNLNAGTAEKDPDGGDNKSPVGSDHVNQVVFSGGVFNAEDDIGFQQDYGPDVNDFYKFTVDAKSSFSLNLTGLSSKADVNLLDSDGILQKKGEGSLDKTIESNLTPGDYYVQVARRGANSTAYDLSMNLNSGGSDDGNNSFAEADPLTGDPLTVSSDVGRTIGGKRDKSDFFEFTASSSGLASVELEAITGDADVTLYDAGKAFLGSASAGEQLPAFLQEGSKYFVEVSAAGSGSSFYDLSVSI